MTDLVHRFRRISRRPEMTTEEADESPPRSR